MLGALGLPNEHPILFQPRVLAFDCFFVRELNLRRWLPAGTTRGEIVLISVITHDFEFHHDFGLRHTLACQCCKDWQRDHIPQTQQRDVQGGLPHAADVLCWVILLRGVPRQWMHILRSQCDLLSMLPLQELKGNQYFSSVLTAIATTLHADPLRFQAIALPSVQAVFLAQVVVLAHCFPDIERANGAALAQRHQDGLHRWRLFWRVRVQHYLESQALHPHRPHLCFRLGGLRNTSAGNTKLVVAWIICSGVNVPAHETISPQNVQDRLHVLPVVADYVGS
mmetsp:Transcript_61401/g.146332  ORF Transcript_61401/g.146332 Transcript_61401/m.146332 type:complete len:281 (-) Transcript_61401:374-1216(-)